MRRGENCAEAKKFTITIHVLYASLPPLVWQLSCLQTECIFAFLTSHVDVIQGITSFHGEFLDTLKEMATYLFF